MPKNLELSLLLDFYGGLLTEKQRTVTAMYYDEDLSLAEIAEAQGISRQGVRDTVKRAEQQMLEMEATLGLAARFRRITDGLAHISKLTNRYIKHPLEVVGVGDIVDCYVDEIKLDKKKVALSLLEPKV